MLKPRNFAAFIIASNGVLLEKTTRGSWEGCRALRKKIAWLPLFARDLFAFLPGFRKAYGNSLLAAFDLATAAALAGFRLAALVAMHFPFDVAAGAS
jgi:hypothetical protein